MELGYPEAEIAKALEQISELTSSFEENVSSLYNEYLYSDEQSVFFSKYNKLAKKFEDDSNSILESAFVLILAAGALSSVKRISALFKKSTSTYIKSAISSYSTSILALSNKNSLAMDEASLRASIVKQLKDSKDNISKYMLKKDNVIISVGKRRYHLENYLNVVANQELRSKFSLGVLLEAKEDGAAGIRISNHGTICPICKPFEGKSYFFDKSPLVSDLKLGIPPFHVGCKHFIIPIPNEI